MPWSKLSLQRNHCLGIAFRTDMIFATQAHIDNHITSLDKLLSDPTFDIEQLARWRQTHIAWFQLQ